MPIEEGMLIMSFAVFESLSKGSWRKRIVHHDRRLVLRRKGYKVSFLYSVLTGEADGRYATMQVCPELVEMA